MEDVQFLQFEPKLVRYCMHCQAHVKGFDHRGSWKLYRSALAPLSQKVTNTCIQQKYNVHKGGRILS
uniref:Uncharacterized protein n=1 Tax=Helianthus annuus TaxID=4232 RepID=A0A251TGA4_HELAN